MNTLHNYHNEFWAGTLHTRHIRLDLPNPFVSNVAFLYPLKTSENPKLFWCFQGVEKRGHLWTNRLKLCSLDQHQQLHPLHKKWSFPLRISSENVTKSQETAVLSTYTEEILNGKLHFLWNDLWYAGAEEKNCVDDMRRSHMIHQYLIKFVKLP